MKLEVRGGSFSYTKGHPVFEDISLELEDQQFLCLLGQNGCGKTTLLKCLAGMMPLSSGKVIINGNHLDSMTRRETALAIGYVPQDQETAFPFTVQQMVLMGRAPSLNFLASPSSRDMTIAEEAMERVGILRLKDQRYTELSGGEKQLVLLGRILAQRPNIWLLDEPTSHLDFKNQTIILRLIRDLVNEGRSVIMTTHYPNHAFAYPTHVALMHDGKILSIGSPEDVLLESNLSQAYGIDICLYTARRKDSDKLVTFCAPVEE